MKLKKHCDASHYLLTTLPALLIFLYLPLAASADESPNLQTQPPSVDSSSPDALSANRTLLQGGVSERAAFDSAIKKLTAKADMTDDDFRNLGIGTIGYEQFRRGGNNTRVEKVFSGSPAEQAGIREGDVIVRDADADNDIAQSQPNGTHYAVVLRRAGTIDEITILRHKRPVTLKVARMNIADIKDDKDRQMWEKMIMNLTDAPDGIYSVPKP
jgi:C-terminal processing protease CtpA/Prc